MATNNNTQIKVKETTKLRLDLLKNSRTYDAVISDMLLYFETTGITPQSKIVSPAVAVKEQASRVIEVVRGIEKTTTARLKNIEQMVSRLFSMQPDADNLHNSDEFMHISAGAGASGTCERAGEGTCPLQGAGSEPQPNLKMRADTPITGRGAICGNCWKWLSASTA